MLKKNILVCFFLASISQFSFSEDKKTNQNNWYESYYKRQLHQILKNKGKQKRSISSDFKLTDANFRSNRKELHGIVQEVTKIQTAEELYSYIKSKDEAYDKGKIKSIDARFYILQLAALRPLKSLAWRADKLLGNTLFDKTLAMANLAQGNLISLLRGVSSWNMLFNRVSSRKYWEAGFDYATQPYKFTFEKPSKIETGCSEHKFGKRFKEAEDVRKFIICELMPSLIKAENRLVGVLKSLEDNKNYNIIMDARLLFGQNAFQAARGNSLERFRKIKMSDVHALMAGIQLGKHQLYLGSIYKLEGLKSILSDLGTQLSLDRDDDGVVESLSARKRTKIFKSHKNYMTLDNDLLVNAKGQNQLYLSWESLQNWMRASKLAWEEIKSRRAAEDIYDEQLTVNPHALAPIIRVSDASIENLERLILQGGNQQFVSVLTGKTIMVNLENMFKSLNNSYINDLKDFLPTAFNTQGKQNGRKIIGAGLYKYRNLKYGEAAGWNIKAYKRVFPNIKNSTDLKNSIRTLSEVWGGAAITGPLIFAML